MAATTALRNARKVTDDLLFPAAMNVDVADRVPAGHLDGLAEAGLYGFTGPAVAGGLGGGQQDLCAVTEVLASGCLATTFVWLQHHRAVRVVAAACESVRERWLAPLCRGRFRAGIALGGDRPGPRCCAHEPRTAATCWRAAPRGFRAGGANCALAAAH